MRYLLFILLLLPALAWGQYPANPNKIRLGYQTTGDGLVYRGSGAPAYTPANINNAWVYLDTVANTLYQYQGGVWNEITPTITPDSLEYTSTTQILGIKNSNSVSLLVNIDGTLAGSNTAAQPLRVDTSVIASKTYAVGLVDGNGIYSGSGTVPTGTVATVAQGNTLVIGTSRTTAGATISLGEATNGVEIVGHDGTNTGVLTAMPSFGRVQAAGKYIYVDPWLIFGPGPIKVSDSLRLEEIPTENTATNVLVDAGSGIVGKRAISNILSSYPDGSGTADFVPKWSDANTLTNSQIQNTAGLVRISDNAAASAVKFEVDQWTTAGRPTGDTAIQGWNTSLGVLDVYGTSAWQQGSIAHGTSAQTLRHDGNIWTPSGLLTNDGSFVRVIGSSTRFIFNPTTYTDGQTMDGNLAYVTNAETAGARLSLTLNQLWLRPVGWTNYANRGVLIAPNGSAITTPANSLLTLNAAANSVLLDLYSAGTRIAKLSSVSGDHGNLSIYSKSASPLFNLYAGTTNVIQGEATTGENGLITVYGQSTNTNRGIKIEQSSNDIAGASIIFAKTRGTLASKTAAQSGDAIGSFSFSAYDGTNYTIDNAWVGGYISGTVGTKKAQTSILFNAGDSTNYTPELMIYHDGNVGVGNLGTSFPAAISPPVYTLDVKSTGAIGLPRGTTAQRPTVAASTTPLRWNTDSTKIEVHTGSAWVGLATSADVSGSYTSWTLAGDGGTPQTISSGNTATISGGIGLTSTASATDVLTVDADTTVLATRNWVWDNSVNLTAGSGIEIVGDSINIGGTVTQTTDLTAANNTLDIGFFEFNEFEWYGPTYTTYVWGRENSATDGLIEITATGSGMTGRVDINKTTAEKVTITAKSNFSTRIHNVILDTTAITFSGVAGSAYSYTFPTTSPSSTLNDTTVFVQIGTGTSATAAWVDKDLFGGGSGTTYTFQDGITEGSGIVSLGGSLTQPATISGNYKLEKTGSIMLGEVFAVENSNALGYGATLTGGAVGVIGTGTSAVGVWGISTDGVAGRFEVEPASTNTSIPILEVTRKTSGTAATSLGGGIQFRIETSDGSDQETGLITSVLTNAATANVTGRLDFSTTNNASSTRKLSIAGNGQLTADNYGDGTFTGTVAYTLAVDSNGNIIETSTSGNIYSTDGTVSANRTVTMNGKKITFDGSIYNPIISSEGYIGINQPTPGAPIDVNGLIYSGDNDYSEGISIAGYYKMGGSGHPTITLPDSSIYTNGGGISGNNGGLEFFGDDDFLGTPPLVITKSGTVTFNDDISVAKTITTAGTTGNQTINKMAGTVNIAAAGTAVTVTNSFVTANSLVFCTLRTNDSTAWIKNVVPGSGSFTINLGAAATAEVSIGFIIIN